MEEELRIATKKNDRANSSVQRLARDLDEVGGQHGQQKNQRAISCIAIALS